MKSRCLLTIVMFVLLCATAYAEPWSVDLEESIQTLPWVFIGELIEVTDSGVTAVISETFRGEHQPGDTLMIPYWEMGSWMSETVSEGNEYLLLPDDTGSLQIIGTPGDGYWLLRGYYDFNAFLTEPGVLNREELLLLCSGDSLPDRCVQMEIRFAGGSEFLEVVFRESDDIWYSRSHFACMDNLMLGKRALTMGGWDTFPYEPEVFMRVSTSGRGLVFFYGKMNSCSDGMYKCKVYPTGLLILDSPSLSRYITRDQMPEEIRIGIELYGADPAELGLADEPYFTLGESGGLQLSGADGMFNIPIIHITDYDSRPVAGFDSPASNDNPLYFRFENLPDGPSGHLATDIIDALAKGTVTGSIGTDPEVGSARFSLYTQSFESSEPSDERYSIAVTGIPSDIEGIDLIITCDPEAANRDYVAETFSSIPLTDTYAVERGVDRGLIFLVFEDMRQVEEFVIPHEEISSVVQIVYDMDVYDRTDVVFTQEKLVMVHSSASNAGMFTRSDVFILPFPETGFECMNQIHSIGTEHERQLDILCIALLFYCRTVVPLNQ